MLAVARVAPGQLRDADAAEAVPAALAVEVEAGGVAVPARLVRDQAPAGPVRAELAAVEADGVRVLAVARLTRPQAAPADAHVADSQRVHAALAVEVATRAQRLGLI